MTHGGSWRNRQEHVPREAYLIARARLARKTGLIEGVTFVSRACHVRLACLAHGERNEETGSLLDFAPLRFLYRLWPKQR
jgi:hypothetical protein